MRATGRTRNTSRRITHTGHVLAGLLACAALTAGAAAVGAARDTPGPEPSFSAVDVALRPEHIAEAPRWTDPGTIAGVSSTSRPFDHVVHEALSCTSCHGAGERHRTLLVKSPRDCAACHHDARSPRTCTVCHPTAALPEPGTVSRELALGVWTGPRTRQLPFGHGVHEQVACRECHGTPVTLAMDRSCGSCHESHHSSATDCAACHTPPMQPVHGAEVHLSCAGAGCHAPNRAPPLTLSRSLCLSCHVAQRDHETDGQCATCHLFRVAGDDS